MNDLAAWLLEQIAADERIARAATAGPWDVGDDGEVRVEEPNQFDYTVWITSDSEGLRSSLNLDDAEHVAHWHPARVLAECDAKRRIMELHEVGQPIGLATEPAGWQVDTTPRCAEDHAAYPCETLRLLAQPYADRPGWRQEWAL